MLLHLCRIGYRELPNRHTSTFNILTQINKTYYVAMLLAVLLERNPPSQYAAKIASVNRVLRFLLASHHLIKFVQY